MTEEFRSREAHAFLAGLEDPHAVQSDVLARTIIGPNVECELGRAHDFASIRTIADYQRAVPIRKYEGFEPWIDRAVAGDTGVLTTEPVKRFFLTSGSTAKPKYIPVTNTFIRAKSRAFGIYWAEVFAAHPEVKAGRMVTNFSDSGEPTRAPGSGLPCSSESAYWAGVTRATSLATTPIIPKSVAQIADSDSRYYTIARILLEEEFTALMTLNPSTILLLLQKLGKNGDALLHDVRHGGLGDAVRCPDAVREHIAARYTGNPARADAIAAAGPDGLLAHRLWPALALAICWRSPMLTPYLDLLAPQLGPVPGRDYILMASEGVMAIPITDGRSGGPLAVGTHFYEFVPEDQIERAAPDVLLPEQLEDGRTYVMILSNGSGLYRYDIGDVVRVRGFVGRTPCIEFLHRAGSTSSLTGEKLTEDQVTMAIQDTARELGLSIVDFTVAPAPTGFPRYVAYVELAEGVVDRDALAAFAARFDAALDRHNIEYGSKRSSERLAAPELALVAGGSFAARRRERLARGTSDSQIKPNHLSRDAATGAGFTVVERFHAG
jgi:hypothetical protein